MGTSAADAEKKLEIPIKAAGPTIPRSCIVHPLVLLSATDHYMRVAKDTNKRVIGVLLGAKEIAGERDTWKTTTASAGEGAYSQAGMVNITNSFAIPFEEDDKDPRIWFADHNYLENMFGMFKKVNAREKIVGWYSTGPKIRASDLEINEVFKKFTKNPVLVIIDVQPKDELVIPTDARFAAERFLHGCTSYARLGGRMARRREGHFSTFRARLGRRKRRRLVLSTCCATSRTQQ